MPIGESVLSISDREASLSTVTCQLSTEKGGTFFLSIPSCQRSFQAGAWFSLAACWRLFLFMAYGYSRKPEASSTRCLLGRAGDIGVAMRLLDKGVDMLFVFDATDVEKVATLDSPSSFACVSSI